MRAVVQRSLNSKVLIEGKVVGEIRKGLVVLVGFTHNDTVDDIKYIVKKIVNLRIFDDEKGIMNLSIKEVNGEILSISQFTLYADTANGNRPSYVNSMNREPAIKLYDIFNEELKNNNIHVETGIFGADMEVHINNSGPVTIIIDSKG